MFRSLLVLCLCVKLGLLCGCDADASKAISKDGPSSAGPSSPSELGKNDPGKTADDKTADDKTADDKTADDMENSLAQAKKARPVSGNIPVDPNGFVTLDSSPRKAPSSDSDRKLEESKKEAARKEPQQHSPESGLATFDEKHQRIAEGWPKPQAVLVFTGQQHGYIEPCGCTGLENQKGGLSRRDTLLTQLKERGWELVPMDVGNFERRVGRQAEIKFQTTVESLKEMQYRSATLGVDDLKLSSAHLLSLTATEGKTTTPFISANAYVLIEEFMPKWKIIEVGGRKIGVTAVLGDSFRTELASSTEVFTSPAADSLPPVVDKLKSAGCDYLVLLAHATLEESQQLSKTVPGFDLVVTAGGYPEPPYELESIDGASSKLLQVGAKGMYAVLVGLYPENEKPVRYERIALSSQFPDSSRMLTKFSNYQKQLESLGFRGLGIRAQSHHDGQFVGSEKCGDCHTQAFDKWKSSGHFHATDSLVKPNNDRGMIPRHFDPECLSCHVTGWNAQSYYPYVSGFESLDKTPMLSGSGCENCHGPGSKHVAAESGQGDDDAAIIEKLRLQMRLPLSEARARCVDCHDQDNSPDFQHDGAFEKYWAKVAHPGKD